MTEDLFPRGSAVFSPCRRWRYRLDRIIAYSGPVIGFLLHNPSSAGAEEDDPTSRRGIGFGRSWGASRIVYVNPWAGVATEPEDLWNMHDPIGPENDAHIAAVAREVTASGGFMVFAWGEVSPPRDMRDEVRDRLAAVDRLVREICPDVRALGLTKAGEPRHPLYMPASAQPVAWTRAGAPQ